MKMTLIIAASLLMLNTDKLIGSVWISKVAKGCVDTLKIKSNSKIVEYSCEQGYSYHGNYTVLNDTLTITEKDDSHSEDGGKITWFKTKYLIRKNLLCLVSNGKLINGTWHYQSVKSNEKSYYKRLR